MTKEQWLERNCFNAEGETYCVYGDDTYSIKEGLKEAGCRFHPLFMWHSTEPLENLPEGYGQFVVSCDDYMMWDEVDHDMIWKTDAKEKIERKFDEHKEPSKSEYVAAVGDRLRNVTVKFTSRRGYNGKFGWCNIFTFKSGDNVFTWFTSSEPEIEEGKAYFLTGTVKKHEEFRSVKTTILSHCILKEIGE